MFMVPVDALLDLDEIFDRTKAMQELRSVVATGSESKRLRKGKHGTDDESCALQA